MKTTRALQPSKPAPDLVGGSIFGTLVRLALPVMTGSMIQIAYGLTDMYWVGTVGDAAVAAVGSGGMILWLLEGLIALSRVGGRVRTGHALGAGDEAAARRSTRTALRLGLVTGLFAMTAVFVFADSIGRVFGLNDRATFDMTVSYLRCVAWGIPFQCLARNYASLYTAAGDARLPLRVTGFGLVLNMFFDYLFIRPFGLGAAGAGLATALSLAIEGIIYFAVSKKRALFKESYFPADFFRHRGGTKSSETQAVPSVRTAWIDLHEAGKILRISLPVFFETTLFSWTSIMMSPIVARYGDLALAAARFGGHAESLTWALADGFSLALSAFIAQNYGARRFDRIRSAYGFAWLVMGMLTLSNTLLFLLSGRTLAGLFFREAEALAHAELYLSILAWSQVFVGAEIVSASSFAGVGKTMLPSSVMISFTVLRLPAAYILSPIFGISAIWWTISLSSMLKGSILTVLFVIYLYRSLSVARFERPIEATLSTAPGEGGLAREAGFSYENGRAGDSGLYGEGERSREG